MSAEATNPAEQGSFGRRRGRPLIDLRNLRRFGRAALLGPAPRGRVPDAIEHVAKAHRAHHPGADLDVLRRAYELAESSHRGQLRKSGEPYITHPLAVTLILAELGAETTTLTASLLHDTVEDTDVTLAQVREQFGEEVRYLVDGVTKLEKVDYGAAAEPETFRKMLVATGNDVRVMSIKLADRLHNMRTLGVMRPEKQVRIAKVTRDVLIPLAERLGVQALKTELEDLVFAILHPDEYERTRELIAGHATRPDPLAETARSVRAVLNEAGIDAQVLVRPRHIVSVYRVRRKRGELTGADLGRLLVLVGEDADCYAVLGELHTCFTPVISEFKDFIAVPKFNLYQSLHTAIAGEGGKVTEVLIRTYQMHKVAEAGVVALGNPYAATGDGAEAPERGAADGAGGAGARGGGADGADGERADPTRPGWLSRLLDWQRAVSDTDTFWSSLRDDLAQDREITVFAVDGTVLSVPEGASCVDAVYARYGAAGHSCVGARVNGRLVTLSTVLHDGDSVEFLMATGRDAASSGPSPEWLTHARTPAARIAISHWLNDHRTTADRLPQPVPGGAPGPRPASDGSTASDGSAAPDAQERTPVPDATPVDGSTGEPASAHGAGEHGDDAGGARTERGAAGPSVPRRVAPAAEPGAAQTIEPRGEAGIAGHGEPHAGAPGPQPRGVRNGARGTEHGAEAEGVRGTGHRAEGVRGTGHGAEGARGTEDGAEDVRSTEHRAERVRSTGREPGVRSTGHGARRAAGGASPAWNGRTVPSGPTTPPGALAGDGTLETPVTPSPAASPPRPGTDGGAARTAPAGGDVTVGPGGGGTPESDHPVTTPGTDPSPTQSLTRATPDPSLDQTARPTPPAVLPSETSTGTAAEPAQRATPRPTPGSAGVPGEGTPGGAGQDDGSAAPVRPGPAGRPAGDEQPGTSEAPSAATGRHDTSAGGDSGTLADCDAAPVPAAAGAPPGPASGAAHGAATEAQRTMPDSPGRRGRSGVLVDQPGATVRLAGCCTPVPPDEVTGFAVRGGAVTVHREPCPVVARMTAAGRQPVAVRWRSDADAAVEYRVTLYAEAFSRPHLLADLTEVIAVQGAEVISAAVEPPYEQRVRHTYTLQLPDAGRLPVLMRAMRQVPSVYDVTRAGHDLAAAGI